MTRTFIVVVCCLLFGCRRGEIVETAGYVSRDKFYQGIGWAYPLPDDARNVRARWELRGTQDNTLYIRFNTNVEKFSSTLREWTRPIFSPSGSRMMSPLQIKNGDYRGIDSSLDWWQPNKIREGYYVNIPDQLAGHGLRIWVDKGESVVYACDEG